MPIMQLNNENAALRCCRGCSCQTYWQSSLYTYQWMGQHEKEWKKQARRLSTMMGNHRREAKILELEFSEGCHYSTPFPNDFYLTWVLSVGQTDIEVYLKMHPSGRHITVNLLPLQKTIQILHNWRLWSWKQVTCFNLLFLFTSFGKTIPLFQSFL